MKSKLQSVVTPNNRLNNNCPWAKAISFIKSSYGLKAVATNIPSVGLKSKLSLLNQLELAVRQEN